METELQGYYQLPFTSIYRFDDPYLYLQSLNFDDAMINQQVQQFMIDEKKIDSMVKEKYKKYKDQESQNPAGSGMYIPQSQPYSLPQRPAMNKFKFNR
jgi:hypothetical protein